MIALCCLSTGAHAQAALAAAEVTKAPRGHLDRHVARAHRTHRRRKAAAAVERGGLQERYRLYEAELAEAARVYQLPRALLRAVARVESDFHHDAVSDKGAVGLMQIIPGTARSMGVTDPRNPRQNILGGARYLRVLANRWRGDLVLVLASYNAGPEAVRRYGGIPPYRETQGYVQRVLRHYRAYAAGQMLPKR